VVDRTQASMTPGRRKQMEVPIDAVRAMDLTPRVACRARIDLVFRFCERARCLLEFTCLLSVNVCCIHFVNADWVDVLFL
jgi:hypothetical protein